MSDAPKLGTVGWMDLTIDDADGLRDFYATVTGWKPEGLSMGDYEDYVMNDASGTPVAGVCHRRGANSKMPARWILYITVADLAAAVEQATKLGAKLLDGPRQAGPHGTFAVLEDPAGATFAVYQHGAA